MKLPKHPKNILRFHWDELVPAISQATIPDPPDGLGRHVGTNQEANMPREGEGKQRPKLDRWERYQRITSGGKRQVSCSTQEAPPQRQTCLSMSHLLWLQTVHESESQRLLPPCIAWTLTSEAQRKNLWRWPAAALCCLQAQGQNNHQHWRCKTGCWRWIESIYSISVFSGLPRRWDMPHVRLNFHCFPSHQEWEEVLKG